MAEGSKNSVAGKIATPRAATPSSTPPAQLIGDPLQSLAKSIGARIKLTTAAPLTQTYEGTLFTACPILNVVIINTRVPSPADSAHPPGDYSIIPVSRIQSFQVLSLANTIEGDFATAQPAIGPVDLKRLKEREGSRIAKLKDEELGRGKGVTKEAQAIFDSFRRINLPIRWHNQEMIVHDAVIISPPYRVEDCKGAKDKQEVLNRVRKVLEGERRKLREREERERKATTPTGSRKGG